mgnify:CR=1 FL=1
MTADARSPLDYRHHVYERYATHYKSTTAFNAQAAERFAALYRHYLRGWLPDNPHAPMIDLACGSGRLLHLYKQLGYDNLAGVDISPEMVHVARQVSDRVEQGDVIETVRRRPGHYQLISAFDLIEHLTKNELLDLLGGCFDALAPGGRLILHTTNADSPMFTQIQYGDFSHEQCFSTAGLRRVLTLSGFEAVEFRERGPLPIGIRGRIRCALWRGIKWAVRTWNTIELGSPGSNVFSRIVLVSAVKPDRAADTTTQAA